MQRAAAPFTAGFPLQQPVQEQAGPSSHPPYRHTPNQLSPVHSVTSHTPLIRPCSRVVKTNSHPAQEGQQQQQQQQQQQPEGFTSCTTAPAPRSQFLSRLRAIPYHHTVKASPPRMVTTTNSLTNLPGTNPAYCSPEIPSSFKIYVRPFHRRPHAYIAQRKAEPLYAITYTRRDVTLHCRPQKLSSPVATFVHASHWNPKKRPAQVRLLNSTGRQRRPTPPSGTSGVRTVAIVASSFTVDVPSPEGQDYRPEKFEWRPSSGRAIAAALRAGNTHSQTHHGMKLVRIATDAGRGSGELATGGGEVVAVLYVSRSLRVKLSTRGYFMFQGTGAQGTLGEAFRMVAVMTAVGMWDRKRRESRGGG